MSKAIQAAMAEQAGAEAFRAFIAARTRPSGTEILMGIVGIEVPEQFHGMEEQYNRGFCEAYDRWLAA